MYDYAVLGTSALSSQPKLKNNNADVLDRPEWEGLLPLVALMAAWSTARRKAALATAKHQDVSLPAVLTRPKTRPAC